MKKYIGKWYGLILSGIIFSFAFCSNVYASVPVRDFAPETESRNTDTEEERISAEDAYRELVNSDTDTPDASDLKAELHDLLLCSGTYIQEKKYETSKTYTANLQFYLQNGDVFCSIEYNGFMGEIDDGSVKQAEDAEYLFEVTATGYLTYDLQTRENPMSFTILVKPDEMHVEWGDSCEYSLYRGNGSAVDLDNEIPPFEESEAYSQILEVLEKAFSEYQYNIEYDKEEKMLTLYMQQFMDGMRTMILLYPDQLRDGAKNFYDQIDDIGERIYSVLHLKNYPDVSFRYVMVDELNDANLYPENAIIYSSINGETTFNLIDESSSEIDVASDKEVSSDEEEYSHDTETSGTLSEVSITPKTSTANASSGEKNALAKAMQYLDYTAFSYSGLIEQLEYEGYTLYNGIYQQYMFAYYRHKESASLSLSCLKRETDCII